MSPPKQKLAPARSAFRSAEQLAGYVTSCVLQARKRMTQHCVACGAHVPNRNFMVTIVAERAHEEEQTLFGFLEEVSLSPTKRDRDATSSILQPNSSHIATEIGGEKWHFSAAAKTEPPHQPTGKIS